MDQIRKQKIAECFPASFEQAELGISISRSEFNVFEVGIYSYDMDDKWNVFVLENVLFLARSWTDYCIYKVFTEQSNDKIVLRNFYVNRDVKQYKGVDIEHDVVVLKKLLQRFLNREDFYSDPRLELKLIKQILDKETGQDDYSKSIGSNSVGTTRKTYQGLIANSNGFYTIDGWEKLEQKLSTRSDDEKLVSLCLQRKQSRNSKTFYFNKDVSKLLGEIVIAETIKWKNLRRQTKNE